MRSVNLSQSSSSESSDVNSADYSVGLDQYESLGSVSENECQASTPEATVENETIHPEPTFTPEDDEMVQSGVRCYYPNCVTNKLDPFYYSYASLLRHVRNIHKCPTVLLKGTHLHIQGVKELNAYQSLKRKQGKTKTTEKESLVDNEAALVASGSTTQEGEQNFTWVVMPCFMKCNIQGQVLQPFQSCGIALPGQPVPQGYEGPPIKKKALPQQTGTMNKYLVDTTSTTLEKKEKVQLTIGKWMKPGPPNWLISDNSESSAFDGVIASDKDLSVSSDGNATSYKMISDIHAFVEKQSDSKKWKKLLPTIAIKATYMDPSKAPMAKGEGVSRATFPKEFSKDFVEIPDFKIYLGELRNKQDFNLEKIYTGIGRLLGFLEITPSDLKPDVAIDSPETLVAFFTSGTHLKMLKSPLMSPKYSWPEMMVTGLEMYVDYQLRQLAILHSGGDPISKYISSL